MKIRGVTHPIPSMYAKRIYEDGKSVFVGKRCLCRVSKGDKFVIYESQGAKAYTGWADIKEIKRINASSILSEYGDKLIITKDELKEYSKNRQEMFIIEFSNFQKFNKLVKPKRFVSVSGKYIYEDEFGMITSKKD